MRQKSMANPDFKPPTKYLYGYVSAYDIITMSLFK